MLQETTLSYYETQELGSKEDVGVLTDSQRSSIAARPYLTFIATVLPLLAPPSLPPGPSPGPFSLAKACAGGAVVQGVQCDGMSVEGQLACSERVRQEACS